MLLCWITAVLDWNCPFTCRRDSDIIFIGKKDSREEVCCKGPCRHLMAEVMGSTFSSSSPQLHWRKPVQLFFSPTPVPLKVKPWGEDEAELCTHSPQCEMETFLANDNIFLPNKVTHFYSPLWKIRGWVANMSNYILREVGLSEISIILRTISQPVKWAETTLHVTVSILNYKLW